MKIKSILVLLEPQDEQGALLEKAERLATALDARVKLFACVYDHALADGGILDPTRFRVRWLEHLREKFHTIAEPLQARGLEVVADAAWHNPIHEGIEQEIECSGVQLVMKSTRPHTLMSRSFFSHTDWQLIRCCPAPLLLVKARSWSAHSRMVAAVDPMHPNDRPGSLDRRILDAGRHLAEALGGELHAIHVRPPSSLSAAASSSRGWQMPIFADTAFAEAEEKELRATIYDLTRSFGIPEGRVHIESGHVADILAEFAEREAMELIIMGAVSRSRLHDFFIGHSAEQVLESLTSDVLIVKPGDGTEGP